GEKVVLKKKDPAGLEGNLVFDAGEIVDGSLRHLGLSVMVMKLADLPAGVREYPDAKAALARDPKARAYVVSLEVEMPGRKGSGVGGRVLHLSSLADDRGVFQFAERPQDAPVLHLGGPWQIALGGRTTLRTGRDVDVTLAVGTRGLGSG